MKTIFKTDFKDVKLIGIGKVRDIYDLGETILLVASDRLSAFDVVFSEPIPCKGTVLTQISKFWFENTSHIIGNHLISCDIDKYPDIVKKYKNELKSRSMLVKKAKTVKAECIVRGYLDGSAYKEYLKTGEICGIKLPEGLRKKDKLSEPVFTPTTKAESGHDENVTFDQLKELIGDEIAEQVRSVSIKIFNYGHEVMLKKGIILSDTKFEFGIDENGSLILIDECMTPDSSRFWVAETYKPDTESVSFDKQYVRDFLEKTDWDKKPPAPKLPENIIQKTTEKYIQAYELITGKKWNFS